MRLFDRLKRWFRGPRSFESVATELAEGLRNGSIDLDPNRSETQMPPCEQAAANGTPRPAPGLLNGVNNSDVSESKQTTSGTESV
jgi:hypothetical protein